MDVGSIVEAATNSKDAPSRNTGTATAVRAEVAADDATKAAGVTNAAV